eukprot:TRINITY_DN757_c0_g2_i1.p1 TRINITY_DN757_c0_g2~~TRINITY_DN757_c0_g2_i1.p1  ORF type:complete len:231 (+),score=68.46 TRINITY_DN757_c0_g2_i1:152-844(+)
MSKVTIHRFTSYIPKSLNTSKDKPTDSNEQKPSEIVNIGKRGDSEECSLERNEATKRKKLELEEQLRLEKEKKELNSCRHNEIMRLIGQQREERSTVIKNLTKKYQRTPYYYKDRRKGANEMIKEELSRRRNSLIQFVVSKIDDMIPQNNSESEALTETKEVGTQTTVAGETTESEDKMQFPKSLLPDKEGVIDLGKDVEAEKKATADNPFLNPKPFKPSLFGSLSAFGK